MISSKIFYYCNEILSIDRDNTFGYKCFKTVTVSLFKKKFIEPSHYVIRRGQNQDIWKASNISFIHKTSPCICRDKVSMAVNVTNILFAQKYLTTPV